MTHIFPGAEMIDIYDGQTIYVVGQSSDEDVSLISAKTNNVVTPLSVQLLQNISSPGIQISAKMNANYFVMSTGQALGVRCGLDEWSVPRQNAWYYYALRVGGETEVGMDTSFWWTKDECVFACSPAMILLKDGKIVNYVSPSADGSKLTPTSQSMLIRTSEVFAVAVCNGKLSPEQCRQWALTIDGIQDLCLMDSGGSSCLEFHGRMLVNTSRKISDALCFYRRENSSPSMGQEGGEEPMPTDNHSYIGNAADSSSTVPSLTNIPTLKGIDVSNWQSSLNLRKIDYDFVVIKATEGTSFVDPYCDSFYQTAKAMGKLRGFYHFARPSNDPVVEAQFFYKNTKNYFGEAIPVLDWEAEYKNNTEWALTWLNEVQRLSGVKPMIYMSESVVNAYDWSKVVAGDYGLWVAKYRDSQPDYNYDMSLAGTAPKVKWWSGYAMWQWTSVGRLNGYSGSLDCDIFYGDRNAWIAYATSKPVNGGNTSASEIEKLKSEIAGLKAQIDSYQKRIDNAVAALKGGESAVL